MESTATKVWFGQSKRATLFEGTCFKILLLIFCVFFRNSFPKLCGKVTNTKTNTKTSTKTNTKTRTNTNLNTGTTWWAAVSWGQHQGQAWKEWRCLLHKCRLSQQITMLLLFLIYHNDKYKNLKKQNKSAVYGK